MINLFTITYPISFFILLSTFLVGCIVSFLFFGILWVLCVITLVCMGCLRIMPIINIINTILRGLFPTRMNAIVDNIKQSFPVSYSTTDDSSPHGPSLYLFHPHGLFTVSHYVHVGTRMTEWRDKNIQGTALHLLWWLPFGKELLETHRFVPSHYSEMKQVIENGQSLSVTLGGIREITMSRDNNITLSIASKRGVFRLALETGTPLVPVIAYGENEIYQQTDNWFIRHLNTLLLKYHMFLAIPTWKSWKTWWSLFQQPLEHPIHTCVGTPIAVTKKDTPTEDDIQALRELYFSELRALYDRTRPAHYEKELTIL